MNEMKTFRLFGMALLAVIMCMNFAACSSSDDDPSKDENEVAVNEKRIKKIIVENRSYDDLYTAEFSYDYDGRLSVLTDGSSSSSTNRIKYYDWKDNSVTQKYTTSDITFNIKNGLITDGLKEHVNNYIHSYKYTYNSSNHLIKVEQTYHDSGNVYTSTCKWDGDKLMEYVDEDGVVYKYSYSGVTCKGWCPLYGTANDGAWELFENMEIFSAHPELVGFKTTQLPDKIESSDGYIYTYTYTLDEDGYVKNCVSRCDHKGHISTDVYSFTWE